MAWTCPPPHKKHPFWRTGTRYNAKGKPQAWWPSVPSVAFNYIIPQPGIHPFSRIHIGRITGMGPKVDRRGTEGTEGLKLTFLFICPFPHYLGPFQEALYRGLGTALGDRRGTEGRTEGLQFAGVWHTSASRIVS